MRVCSSLWNFHHHFFRGLVGGTPMLSSTRPCEKFWFQNSPTLSAPCCLAISLQVTANEGLFAQKLIKCWPIQLMAKIPSNFDLLGYRPGKLSWGVVRCLDLAWTRQWLLCWDAAQLLRKNTRKLSIDLLWGRKDGGTEGRHIHIHICNLPGFCHF